MLRMDGFSYRHASSWAEARALWESSEGPMYVAGGTDLLPNVKHGLFKPKTLIGIGGIEGGVALDGAVCRIGGATRLDEVAANPLIRDRLAPLAAAAAVVASPQIRSMGTIGGNVLLDTRCLYYNQTEFWRQSLGYCLKNTGTWCHVVGGPKTCVAAQSSDLVPVLLAFDARLRILGQDGERDLPIRELYAFNGMAHLTIQPGELLTEVRVPLPAAGMRGAYEKLRTRDSIDFPQLGLAIVGVWEGNVPSSLEIVVGAVNPQPKPVRGLEAFLGAPCDAAAIEAIADLVFKQTRPQASLHGDPAWRRQMARVLTARSLRKLAAV